MLSKGIETYNFGVHLYKLRTKQRITLERLSELSGISTAHLSRIETNMRGTPKPLTIQKLSEALTVPYEGLLEVAGYITKSRPQLKTGIGNAADLRTDTVERHKINNGMTLVSLSQVVNAWLDKNPDKHVIDIKPTETFALIIYKEGESA